MPGAGPPTAVARGAAFAQTNCARCHEVGLSGVSPDRRAPPFHALSGQYVGVSLEQKFQAIADLGHYAMRTLRIGPDEAADMAAYMDSLARE